MTQDGHAATSERERRSADRGAPIIFRVSVAEKARLVEEAQLLGLTVQQFCELRLLGVAKPKRRSGRQPRACDQQEELIAS